MEEHHSISISVSGTFTNECLPVNSTLPLVIYEYDKGGSFELSLPTVTFTSFGVEVSTPGTFGFDVPSRSTPYVIESVSRNFYQANKNIANPGINPGQYNNWRSWGLQNCNVTLVTENSWIQ